MSEYATSGAMIVCTCGSAPGNLQVTSNLTVSAQGQPIATASDKAPMANIPVFGTCTMKPSISGFLPCVPAPTAWSGFVASVNVPGGNPLLKTSTIQCGCGGMISFQDSGQKKNAKVVINPSSAQITALKKAAIAGIPFCEECEKKKKAYSPRITQIYWIDENGEDIRSLSELDEGTDVTLFVDVEGVEINNTISIYIKAPEGKLFSDKSNVMEITAKVEEGDRGFIGIIENFKFEFDGNSE